jgi:hypothetical protein
LTTLEIPRAHAGKMLIVGLGLREGFAGQKLVLVRIA